MTRKALLLTILAAFTLWPLAAADNAAKIVEKLQKQYSGLDDAYVEFTQTVKFAVTGNEQSFSGKLWMMKGQKYRIELEDQTIVTDGASVWSHSKAHGQVLIDRYREDPHSFSPDKLVASLPREYTPTTVGQEKWAKRDITILKLLPKDDDSDFRWMKVWVDVDEPLMRRIQVLDVSDNLTTYSIDSLRTNGGVTESMFRFTPPTGVNVLDLR